MGPPVFKPTTFGKFYLYEKLAIGGMAEIFKAKLYGIAGFEKTLVVKQILPEYASEQEFVKMFIDEANIAVSLTHGNIVPVYELGKIAERYYIAMEYVDGENMETVIDEVAKKKSAIPVTKAVEICIEVLKGLDYAHRKQGHDGRSLGIVHRDVSPQNVMVSFDGEVKIVDFGIAKAASKLSLTRVGTLKGKFGYMSPEQAAGTDVDRRTDVYAAGILLWELLTGKRLFDAENDVELLKKVRAANAPPPSRISSRVPPELDRLVLRALAKDPAERYQEAAQFQMDLQRWLFSRPEDPSDLPLASWMRVLFGRETGPPAQRPTPPPQPAIAPSPTSTEPFVQREADKPTVERPRRGVSFARNSEIVRVLEQAEAAAERMIVPGADASRLPESSFTSTAETHETRESPDVLGDDTRSQSISGDLFIASTTIEIVGVGAGASDAAIDWDETTDGKLRRPGEGEFVERTSPDGPIVRVPTQGRRAAREIPAPWQAGAIPQDDEGSNPGTNATVPARPIARAEAARRQGPGAPAPGLTPFPGDVTGDTRKPAAEEPPLFGTRPKPRSSRGLAFASLGVVAFAGIGAVALVATGTIPFADRRVEATATPTPSPRPTSMATGPGISRTPRPVATAAAATAKTSAPAAATPAVSATPVPAGVAVVTPRRTPVPAVGMGTISVQSTPWGEVSIDGKKVKNTPLLNHPIRAGTHTVTVHCPTLKKSETRTIVVRANEDLPPLIFTFAE